MRSYWGFTLACVSFSIIVGCASVLGDSGLAPREVFQSFLSGSKPLSDYERQELDRSKAWKTLVGRSEVQSISNARLEIEASGSLGNGIQKVEDTFLTRAAAETLREGYDGFVIRYLAYESQFPVSMSNGFTTFPETVRIDSYEEFLSYSREQRLFLSAGGMGFKKISGVIEMHNDGDDSHIEFFDARELFENFIETYRYR